MSFPVGDYLSDEPPRLSIQSVLFGGDALEISWIDPEKNRSGVVKVDTWQIPVADVETEYNVLQVAIQELIDAAALADRNPPNTIQR